MRNDFSFHRYCFKCTQKELDDASMKFYECKHSELTAYRKALLRKMLRAEFPSVSHDRTEIRVE